MRKTFPRVFRFIVATLVATAALANPKAIIETTLGEIVVELAPEQAPETVANFIDLAENGFYDGIIFHRVIAGYVIQAGGFDEAMEYRYPPRKVINESFAGLNNERWTIAMAREEHPDTADSQFYINMADNEHLDARPGAPGYTVFGRVVEGFTNAEDIELVDTAIISNMANVPIVPVVIRGVRIER